MQLLSWTPSPEVIERARVTAFMREQGIDDWHELHARAQDDIGWFWGAVVQHLGIEFFTPYATVFDDSDGPMWTRWFTGGTINLTHTCVDRHARFTP
jgi:acetyl-CoA synthetase